MLRCRHRHSFPLVRGRQADLNGHDGNQAHHTCWCFIPLSLILFPTVLQVLQKMPKMNSACTMHFLVHIFLNTDSQKGNPVHWPPGPTPKQARWIISSVKSESCAYPLEGLTHPCSLILCLSIPCSVSNGNYTVTKQPVNTHKMIWLRTSLPAEEKHIYL